MDQPPARQLAHRHRRGDGALCPRGAGARQCTGAHACADHRPEPGQRHAPDGYEGGRAVPLAWQVKNTQGAIGFAEQRAALDRVAALLPAGVRPVLMGDRFYGSPALIAWCRAQGWDWRLRLKQDLLVFEAGGETTL